MDASFIQFIVFIPVVAAVVWSIVIIRVLRGKSSGSPEMQSISGAIQEGSRAYLNRQYKAVAFVAIPLFLCIGVGVSWNAAFGFAAGALASALAGYIGMNVAVRANAKTTEAARQGLAPALSLAFKAGSVTGFLVVALGLLAVAGFFFATRDPKSLIGLGFGASLISIFARLGGGIFTKAADVGTDLVGKVEAGIPEDDPRNPGVIADNVGDNVGDCAGMAADLFETYAVTLAAAVLLGSSVGAVEWEQSVNPPGNHAIFPLVLGGLAIVASLIGGFFVKLGASRSIMGALYKGLTASLIVAAGLFFWASRFFFGGEYLNIFLSAAVGLAVTVLMVLVTDYYTAKRYRPVRVIAEASRSGHGTNIIMGLAMGMESTFLPILIIGGGILASFWLSGLYGIAIAATAMLSVAGIIVAIDSFGPITDNAGGIAEMTNAPKDVREVTDALDAVGNTTKAVTKGYAIASAGLAALRPPSVRARVPP